MAVTETEANRNRIYDVNKVRILITCTYSESRYADAADGSAM